jgi:hypothetical protein
MEKMFLKKQGTKTISAEGFHLKISRLTNEEEKPGIILILSIFISFLVMLYHQQS